MSAASTNLAQPQSGDVAGEPKKRHPLIPAVLSSLLSLLIVVAMILFVGKSEEHRKGSKRSTILASSDGSQRK